MNPILFPDRQKAREREREKRATRTSLGFTHIYETLKKFVAQKPSRDEKQRITNSLHSLVKEDDSDELQFFLLKKRFDDLSFCVVTIVKTCLFII